MPQCGNLQSLTETIRFMFLHLCCERLNRHSKSLILCFELLYLYTESADRQFEGLNFGFEHFFLCYMAPTASFRIPYIPCALISIGRIPRIRCRRRLLWG